MDNEIDIYGVELNHTFDTGERIGFALSWEANIGGGIMTFVKNEEGYTYVETECLQDNSKNFVKRVLDKFIEDIIIIK